jgi:hypothetical protein
VNPDTDPGFLRNPDPDPTLKKNLNFLQQAKIEIKKGTLQLFGMK